MLDRRRLLYLSTLGLGGALLVPAAVVTAGQKSQAAPATTDPHAGHAGHLAHGDIPFTGSALTASPFTVPMPLPPTLRPALSLADTDFYYLRHGTANVEIFPGKTTEVYGFGGSYVGPTIRAKTGRRVVVAHTNGLSDPTAIHLHGGHTAASSDGYPMDLINPGGTKLYTYLNRQPGGTMWYHDHAHGLEAQHVYRGMHGFYLLYDEHEEARLRLPSGAYDVPIMLTDAQFADDGSLIWVDDDFVNRNTILVNGRPQPYFRVAARRYRLRFLNASNLRLFDLRLGSAEPLVQIGSDSGLLPAPVPATRFALSPGERADIVVDFARYPVGTQLVLADATGGPVMRFDVTRTAHDESRVPPALRAPVALPPASTTRELEFGINFATGLFAINGQVFDPDRIDATIKRGTTEIWQVTNTDTQLGIPHNLHIHLVQFRLLDRDGQPPTPVEAGLKDTIVINPGETIRVQATFADFLGRYVYHCHMLDHSANGMMAQMEIVA